MISPTKSPASQYRQLCRNSAINAFLFHGPLGWLADAQNIILNAIPLGPALHCSGSAPPHLGPRTVDIIIFCSLNTIARRIDHPFAIFFLLGISSARQSRGMTCKTCHLSQFHVMANYMWMMMLNLRNFLRSQPSTIYLRQIFCTSMGSSLHVTSIQLYGE